MKLQVCLLLAILFASGAKSENSAALGEYPWHVYLWLYNDVDYRHCDGGLIRHNWALTAAHCIYDSTWIYARIGGVDTTWGFEEYTFVEYDGYKFTYANYDINTPYINDIGLIFLYGFEASILNSPNIALIPLPSPGDVNLVGLQSTITGFSKITDDYLILRHITFPVMSDAWCAGTHGFTNPNTLCTDTTLDMSPCLEDSGGPLTTVTGGQRVIIGVGSSFRIGEPCNVGHHGLFTRVTSHLSWINDRLANPPTPPVTTPIPETF